MASLRPVTCDLRKSQLLLPSQKERPQGRPRHKWVDNIKLDLREIGWDGMDWIDLAQDREQWRTHVIMVMNLPDP
jgi:hypothetical protein